MTMRERLMRHWSAGGRVLLALEGTVYCVRAEHAVVVRDAVPPERGIEMGYRGTWRHVPAGAIRLLTRML